MGKLYQFYQKKFFKKNAITVTGDSFLKKYKV